MKSLLVFIVCMLHFALAAVYSEPPLQVQLLGDWKVAKVTNAQGKRLDEEAVNITFSAANTVWFKTGRQIEKGNFSIDNNKIKIGLPPSGDIKEEFVGKAELQAGILTLEGNLNTSVRGERSRSEKIKWTMIRTSK